MKKTDIDIIRSKRNWGVLNHRRPMSEHRKARIVFATAVAVAVLVPAVAALVILAKEGA